MAAHSTTSRTSFVDHLIQNEQIDNCSITSREDDSNNDTEQETQNVINDLKEAFSFFIELTEKKIDSNLETE